MNKSQQLLVREFTSESTGQALPECPVPLDKGSVLWITRMIMSELHELCCTVSETPDEVLREAFDTLDMSKNKMPETTEELVADQADAFVDILYYLLNQTSKSGINLDRLFDIVHAANMAKRDPETGKFIRREDGKVMKPVGWKAPDLLSEIKFQMEHGSFPEPDSERVGRLFAEQFTEEECAQILVSMSKQFVE